MGSMPCGELWHAGVFKRLKTIMIGVFKIDLLEFELEILMTQLLCKVKMTDFAC